MRGVLDSATPLAPPLDSPQNHLFDRYRKSQWWLEMHARQHRVSTATRNARGATGGSTNDSSIGDTHRFNDFSDLKNFNSENSSCKTESEVPTRFLILRSGALESTGRTKMMRRMPWEGTQLSLHVFSCVITSWQRHCHCACISVVPSKDATPFILCARLVKIRAPQAKIFMF